MKERVKTTIGILAVSLSISAYYLGSAPFTPAVLLVAVSGPLAIISLFKKVWRLGLLAMYFSVFAVLTSPSFGIVPFTSDKVFSGAAWAGLVLAVALWFNWLRNAKVT